MLKALRAAPMREGESVRPEIPLVCESAQESLAIIPRPRSAPGRVLSRCCHENSSPQMPALIFCCATQGGVVVGGVGVAAGKVAERAGHGAGAANGDDRVAELLIEIPRLDRAEGPQFLLEKQPGGRQRPRAVHCEVDRGHASRTAFRGQRRARWNSLQRGLPTDGGERRPALRLEFWLRVYRPIGTGSVAISQSGQSESRPKDFTGRR